ncbi:MAG: PASTA domain-containing protein [Candidatus Bathyarchaeota archaeon]|nr:PASTA domain-containing protein [Candidatus Bathyarchaeota archaeon]
MSRRTVDIDVEKLREDIKVRDQSIASLRLEIAGTRESIKSLTQRSTALQFEVTKLLGENQELKQRLDQIQLERPSLKSDTLIHVFQKSIEKMQEGLKAPGQRVGYTISNLDVQLKANVGVDDEGEITFQLPRIGEKPTIESLSVLSFNLRPIPVIPAEPDDRVEVPNLIGVEKELAEELIKAAGLSVGDVKEITSLTRPGLVVGQSPEAYARAPAGTKVDLIVSRVASTKTPNLIGLDLDTATSAILSVGLVKGQISEKQSRSKPGTVIGQNPEPEALIEKGSPVDLVIAKPEEVATPDLIGRPESEVEKTLAGSGLVLGVMSYSVSRQSPGIVLRQDPKPNLVVPAGTPVDVTISKPRTVRVPDLTGKAGNEAEQLLREAGLSRGRRTVRPSTKEEGTVIDQTPEPGRDVATGTAVDVVHATRRIESVTGIGPRLGARLRRINIGDVTELVDAPLASLRRALGGETAERILTDVRRVVASETLIDTVDSESIDALVWSGVYNRRTLAEAEPEKLHGEIAASIEKGDIELPEGYVLSEDKIKRWVESARG